MTTKPAVEIDLDRVPETTDEARAYLARWHRESFTSAPFFSSYIENTLAGDFAYHLARWLARQSQSEAAQARASQAVAEPVATVEEGKFANRLQWVSDEAMVSVPVGSKLYAAPVAQQSEAALDVRHGFERWMSDRGEAVNYAGDGMYEYRSTNKQAEAFRAGVEYALGAPASQPVEAGAPTAAAENCDTMYVCPERDIECGRRQANWCATCPQRAVSPDMGIPASGRSSSSVSEGEALQTARNALTLLARNLVPHNPRAVAAGALEAMDAALSRAATKAAGAADAPKEPSAFVQHLHNSAKMVEGWPEWKRGLWAPAEDAREEVRGMPPERRLKALQTLCDQHFNTILELRAENDELRASSVPAIPGTGREKVEAQGHRGDWYLMANARRLKDQPIRAVRAMSNWAFASELFATGSTSAHRICRAAGIDPYGLTVTRASYPHPSEAKAGEPGPWQVLEMKDQPEPGRLLDVVLTNGVIEEGREHSAIDWTQVADWRYSRAKAGEDA